MSFSSNIILSHDSAARCWLGMHLDGADAPVPYRGNPLPTSTSPGTSIVSDLQANPLLAGHPLHVLVGRNTTRTTSSCICVHSCAEVLPQGSFAQVAPGLFLVSPELCYLQMSRSLTLPQIAQLGNALCASYCIDPATRAMAQRENPATTLRRLAFYIERARGLIGSVPAKRALAWVTSGSESPLETSCMLMLCLPQRMGGYGLPMPECNRAIEAGAKRYLVGQGGFRLDMCWPDSMLAVEYDGRESHADAHADKRRRNDLEALGWAYVSITSSELYDVMRFDKVAMQAARRLNRRIRKRADWLDLHLRLRAELGVVVGAGGLGPLAS